MINIPATLLLTLSLIFSGSTLTPETEAHLKNVAHQYLTQQSQVLSVQSAPKIAKTDVSILDLLQGRYTPEKPTAKNMTPAVAPLLAPAQAQTAPKTMAMSTNAYETDINPVQPKATPLKPTAPAKQSNPIKLSEKRDANGNPYASIEAYIADTYVLAKDTDFEGTRNGQFVYRGSEPYVKIPTTIKGVKLTSTANMFQGSLVKGVLSDNSAITDMRQMFDDAGSPTLELILNTSNVTDMSRMFTSSKANELILTSFDTSKVEDFTQMFGGAKATTLDVSTFNTKATKYMTFMFEATKDPNLNIRHFDVSNTESLTGMFAKASTKTLDLRHFDTSGTRFMDRLFADSQATTIDISNFSFEGAYEINGMFAGAKVLSVDFSNLLVTGGGYLKKNSLTSDSNIKTIYINQRQDPEAFKTYAHPDNNTNLIVK